MKNYQKFLSEVTLIYLSEFSISEEIKQIQKRPCMVGKK